MEQKEKHSIWCYMRKGWISYVRGAKRYAKNHDDVKWGKGTKKPTSVEKDGNKTIYKF